jgi:hypothetical protein
MIEQDNKTWYWYDRYSYNNKGVITQGMYTTHKPSKHDAWQAKKDCFKKGGPKEITTSSPNASTVTTGLGDSLVAKLSLSRSLQAALVTKAGCM